MSYEEMTRQIGQKIKQSHTSWVKSLKRAIPLTRDIFASQFNKVKFQRLELSGSPLLVLR